MVPRLSLPALRTPMATRLSQRSCSWTGLRGRCLTGRRYVRCRCLVSLGRTKRYLSIKKLAQHEHGKSWSRGTGVHVCDVLSASLSLRLNQLTIQEAALPCQISCFCNISCFPTHHRAPPSSSPFSVAARTLVLLIKRSHFHHLRSSSSEPSFESSSCVSSSIRAIL